MSVHKKIREGRIRLGLNPEQFAKLVGVTRGSVQQWEKEGGTAPKRDRQQAVADALQITVAELMAQDPPPQGAVVAQSMSHLYPIVVPTIVWEDLMTTKFPKVFKVALPDNSMAPRAAEGALIEFTQGIEPKAGDGVLVRDRAGNHYFREYRPGRVGVWTAYAYNAAFAPLHSENDGLEVVAVLTAQPTRWAA